MLRLALTALLLAQGGPAGSGAALAPETVRLLQLRHRLGVEDRANPEAIYIYSQASHHLTDEYSRVAMRSGDGRWTIVSIGETRSGILHVTPEVFGRDTQQLGEEASRTLDRLLRTRSLYRQASPRERSAGVGAFLHTMEIVSPEGHHVLRWTGRLRGPGGQVADLIMAHDQIR